MADAQAAIFREGSGHHYWLEYDLRETASVAEVRAAVSSILALRSDVDDQPDANLVVAFSDGVWRELAPDCVPGGLRSFEPIAGADGHHAPATQHGLWFWIHGDRHDQNVACALQIHRVMQGIATLALEEQGFTYRDSRDLTGFVDGSANPKEDARFAVAMVPEGQPGAGGSFVIAQRWVHNLEAFHALDQGAQERVIGRTKPDSVELEGDAMPPDSHVSRTDLKQDGEGVKIYRRSAPFAKMCEHGLYFQAFACALERFDLLLSSMFGTTGDGVHDRLIEFSQPTSGSYYFAPSQQDIEKAVRQ